MKLVWWELGVAVIAALVVWRLVSSVRRWAERHNLLDVPISRSAHSRPRPRLGGIGIAPPVSAGCVAAWLVGVPRADALMSVLAISGLVAVVGLMDDLRGLPALPRLAVHVLAGVATVVVLGGATEIALPDGFSWRLGGLGAAILVTWIAGFINAFNFMDGIDGIAGSQAAIAGAAWAVIGWILDEPVLSWGGCLIAGACVGFLVHNWQPSRIFLGDIGATFLGYWLAALPFLTRQPAAHLMPGLLIVWPFAADAAFTLLGRLRRREYVFAGHQQHIYQRLVATGFTHAEVSLIYSGLSAVGAIGAVAMVVNRPAVSAIAIVVIVIGAVALQQLVVRRERQLPDSRARAGARAER